MIPFAQQLQRETGIPASITMAQYIQESGLKPSGLAKNYNNLFGVKASEGWKGKSVNMGTHEYVNGKKVNQSASFRVYDSLEDAFRDRGKFLSGNRYKNLFQTKDPVQWAYGLQKAGYATDPNYAKYLINHIKNYELSKYDS